MTFFNIHVTQLLPLLLLLVTISRSSVALASLSEEQAETLVHHTIAEFADEIVATHHLPIDIRFNWANDIFQALGGRLENVVRFEFFGGLLNGEMDADTFSVVLCHEIGHVLGGAPETRPYPYPMNSVEGQADYFATSKCLRRVFASAGNIAFIHDENIPESVRQPCADAFDANDEALCVRSLLSVLRSFRLMYSDSSLGFDAVDAHEAPSTLMGYPTVQCRLDTLKAGAVCTKSAWESFSFVDPIAGACQENGSPDQFAGARPRCWFKP